MKKFKQLLCLALALTISASLLAACGQKNNGGSKDSDEKVLTYAVEGGSAGEEIALEKGWKVTTLEDQAAALMEVASGTSDAAIIDLLMAGAMIGEGTSYPDLTYTDRLTEEEYGIGFKKGNDELREAVQDDTNIDEELGDLLFAAVRVASTLDKDPEQALHSACEKFIKRFTAMEQSILASGRTLEELSREELLASWDAQKRNGR